jgi:hypothetical protein
VKRPIVPALFIVLLTGCEQQDAVPLSRSVPVALLQLVVLLGSVLGGFLLLERTARRRAADTDVPAAGERHLLDVIGALLFGALGLAVATVLALAIVSIPNSYAKDTVDIFSWEDSVGICWVLMVPAIPFSLFQLRLAAACWARRPWAAWGASAQVLLVVGGFLWSTAPSA